MSRKSLPLLSIVVPVYNERAGIAAFHQSLMEQIQRLTDCQFEVLYCDDGSNDGTRAILRDVAAATKPVRLICLSRNFGKEIATTAGIREASGSAIITIDADGQHPVELLPTFIEAWKDGGKVIIGLRATNRQANLLKRWGSAVFYSVFNRVARLRLTPGATDFRLIDKSVQAEFAQLTEHNRITRGLIDWLGYDRTYIPFSEKPRVHGQAGYSLKKLVKLAVDSAISLSSSPLYITAYLGALILPLATLLGLIMVLDKLVGDPFNWHATGGAYLTVLVLILLGILMMSQGIIGLYLSHIHSETQNRPLYIIDREASVRLQ